MNTIRSCRRAVAPVFALALTLLFAAPGRGIAAETLVAVAANFTDVVRELAPAFEKKTGHTLSVTVGSTGKLYAQIINGAPFEILLAADQARPARLEKEGGAVAGTRFTYAVGRLTLWSADPDLLADDVKAVLTSGETRHVAIANPDLAPYGAAAKQALQGLGLWDELSGKIVMAENIGQTFAMVATGNARVGFVALSAALAPGNTHKGSRWDVPAESYNPVRQDAVLLEKGRDSEAAKAFLTYLRSDETLAVIERYGYGVE